jgi:hypothetical protein
MRPIAYRRRGWGGSKDGRPLGDVLGRRTLSGCQSTSVLARSSVDGRPWADVVMTAVRGRPSIDGNPWVTVLVLSFMVGRSWANFRGHPWTSVHGRTSTAVFERPSMHGRSWPLWAAVHGRPSMHDRSWTAGRGGRP